MSFAERVSSKVFSWIHGNNLVYNTCWEDPRIDKKALNLTPKDNVLVITSAGCNALSYALSGVNHVYAVDMNYRQNALLDLKIAAIKELEYETFFQLFGEGRLPGVLQLYRDRLRNRLPELSQMFWDRYIKSFFDNPRKTFYFSGSSGFLAQQVNRYATFRGLRTQIDRIFNAKTLEDQKEIWKTCRNRFWSPLLKAILNCDTTMSLVGVPKAQRKQIETTYGALVPFIQNCLDSVFGDLPIQDNYFWRVYAMGSYTKTCCPEYLTHDGFETLKGGAVDSITTHTASLEEFMSRAPNLKISRFVLLDHMDWLSDKLFYLLVDEWNAIFKVAAPEARAIWRSGGLDVSNYLHKVQIRLNAKDYPLSDLLTYRCEEAEELHQQCRVHTYGRFYIADLQTP